MLGWLLVFAGCVFSAEIFKKSPHVINLSVKNFKQVTDDSGLVFVMFYADWCGHCKNFAPTYAKAAEKLSGLVKFAAIDAQNEQGLSSKYGIQGFPTIKIFGTDKKNPTEYEGGRSVEDIVKTITKMINEAAGIKEGKKAKKATGGAGAAAMDGDVHVLTEDNFDEKIQASDKPWIIKFFAPWCGHCKNMAADFKQAATELKGRVNLAEVDCTVHKELASKYGIRGFPTIKYFKSNTGNYDVEDYQGGRSAADFINFVDTHIGAEKAVVSQLLLDGDLKECMKNTLCVLAFLPPLADSSAKEREQHLFTLEEAMSKGTSKNYKWLWTEGLVNAELEKALRVDELSFPFLVVFRAEKKVFYINRNSFTEKGISDFFSSLKGGKAIVTDLPEKLPKVAAVQPSAEL